MSNNMTAVMPPVNLENEGAVKKTTFTAALIGNPNCGKTLLFNRLTGSNQKVANFPGITVAKKTGRIIGSNTDLVDLPGVYSLSSYSTEEKVTRDYLLEEKPSYIINIIDSTNIARNLYLTLQLLEINIPVIIIANMTDELKRLNINIDFKKIGKLLNVPIIPASAKKGKNIDLIEAGVKEIERQLQDKTFSRDKLTISNEIDALKREVIEIAGLKKDEYEQWYAIKLLEMDRTILHRVGISGKRLDKVDTLIHSYLDNIPHNDHETFIAYERYIFIDRIIDETVSQKAHLSMHNFSDGIDNLLTNRILAIPIFALLMYLIFSITFGSLGSLLKEYIEIGIEWVSTSLADIFTSVVMPEWFSSLIIDGIIGGVGGVVTFLPQIIILFTLLTILEDTGYMSRVAFIMDRFFRGIGLSGKAFIPMLLGFGCSTPAALATRTLDNEKDRRLTLFLVPFMSCSAKIPIYLLFAGIFFPDKAGLVMTMMYLLGVVVAVVCALVLKNTVFKGVSSPFVLEIPPYRIPSFKSIVKQVWEKTRGFLIKAGTIIFAMSVVVWVLQTFDISFNMVEDSKDSILAIMGRGISVIFAPLGFGFWQAGVAVLTGIVGKEIVVSTFNVLLPGEALREMFTPASAVAFMTFALLYIPCISASVTISRELKSRRWSIGLIVWQTAVAYTVAYLVYTVALIVL